MTEKAHLGGSGWALTSPLLGHQLELSAMVGEQGGALGCCQRPALFGANSLLKEKLSDSLRV